MSYIIFFKVILVAHVRSHLVVLSKMNSVKSIDADLQLTDVKTVPRNVACVLYSVGL